MVVLQLLYTEAHPTDEGEGPGGHDGRHPAGAAGESTQGHRQVRSGQVRLRVSRQFPNAKREMLVSILAAE